MEWNTACPGHWMMDLAGTSFGLKRNDLVTTVAQAAPFSNNDRDVWRRKLSAADEYARAPLYTLKSDDASEPGAVQPAVTYLEVMQGGELGISSFRIPGFVTTNGTLHVFAEGREHSCGDRSPHSLVYRRSTNQGKSFERLRRIVDPPKIWGPEEGGPHGGAVMDPCPVYDAATDTLHVFFSYNPAHYMRYAYNHTGHLPWLPQATEMWAVK